MKITLLAGVFPKLSKTFVLNQTTDLVDRGHEVDFFAHAPESEEEREHEL